MKITNIFAIIDPTSDNQILLNRLGRISRRVESAECVNITAYCCHFWNAPTSDEAMFERVATSRMVMWIESLFAELVATGVNLEIRMEWDPDWRDRLAHAVGEADCDLVVKNSYSHRPEIGRLAKQIDRAILRRAKAPVLLLRRGTDHEDSGVILAALKTANLDEPHRKANENIIEYCKSLVATSDRFEFHVVTTYSDADNFVYPEDLAKLAGVDRTRAHTVAASPMKGIAQVAGELDAEIVFIGSVKRSGVKGRLLGNTAEQVLDSLNSDIVVYIQE